jgi:hypothetical protein
MRLVPVSLRLEDQALQSHQGPKACTTRRWDWEKEENGMMGHIQLFWT